ncbi:hypothetical protein LJR045_000967 [Microbacterium sp. LjRoot45]|uniref:hypothetical protein n=1 Tax=Microbacterium sp. LjRoot45 TaxID=3342329 RepID=UPI003ECE9206
MKIKKGTRIEVAYSDGYSISWESQEDCAPDHLVDVIRRLEAIDPKSSDQS